VKRLKKGKAHRPMIAHLNDDELQEFIGKHLFERSFYYNQAHQLVKSGESTPTEIAETIVNSLV
jgi:shikimate kinase